MTWQATAPAVSSKDVTITRDDGSMVIESFRGKIRDAVATGTVSHGTTNYAPLLSTIGFIQDLTAGTVSILR